jgi:hypothetical protein
MVTWTNRRPPRVDDAEQPKHSRWSRLKEMGLSAFIVMALVIAVLWGVPDSPLKNTIAPELVPVARATGLDQGWNMFSPNPPRVVSEIETYVQFSDGQRRMWQFERDRNILRSFNYDRWRKLKEQLLREEVLRPGFAVWVIRQLAKPGERAVRVWMVRDTRVIPTPGKDGEPVKWERKLLYDLQFGGAK